MYDVQGRLNTLLSGTLTLHDINTDAGNNTITSLLKCEHELYLDPCKTLDDDEETSLDIII
jgi:hypothetical protein